MSRGLVTNTAAYTADYHRLFEAETGRLLRRRFIWYISVAVTLGVVWELARLAIGLIGAGEAGDPIWTKLQIFFTSLIDAGRLRFVIVSVLWVGMYGSVLWWVVAKRPRSETMLPVSLGLVTLHGIASVIVWAGGDAAWVGVFAFGITHFVATLFLPWTPKQALKPVLVVLPFAWLIAHVVTEPIWRIEGSILWTLAFASMQAIAGVPGLIVTYIRHSQRVKQFKIRFLQKRYSDVRRELVDAQRIHESLFPRPITSGDVRVEFTYQPAHAIGGDFLYVTEAGGGTSMVLIDVTGHGIPAALTVNRLHGELERLFAENPEIGPGEVLTRLNSYVNLTLSGHSIFATALCVRVDPGMDELTFASGGHPPAFLRGVDDTMHELNSTALVLGALPPEAFDAGQESCRFGPGDSLVVYTDGAIEAKVGEREMLGLDGVRRFLVSSREQGQFAGRLRTFVDGLRHGPVQDDMLIAEMWRPLPNEPERNAANVRGVGVKV
ncbi:MAG: PP2C family protein-serine/threonine phosphatase [Planctomycetota bacterium]